MKRLAVALLTALLTSAAPAAAADSAAPPDSMGPAAPAQGELAIGLLRASPTFASLSDAGIAQLAERAAPRLLQTGEAVVREGETTDSLFLLAAGDYAVLRQGNTTPIARLGAGEVIGEYALLTGAARTATVQATETGLVFELSREVMAPVLRANPQLVTAMAQLMAQRLNRYKPEGPSVETLTKEIAEKAKARLGL